jgi:hypothetical protein
MKSKSGMKDCASLWESVDGAKSMAGTHFSVTQAGFL